MTAVNNLRQSSRDPYPAYVTSGDGLRPEQRQPRAGATEQDARDATVHSATLAAASLRLSRRQYILAAAGVAIAAVTGYVGVAATKNYWPFRTSGTGDSIGDLAAQLEQAAGSAQRVAVLHEIGSRAKVGHGERSAAIEVLAEFLRTQKGVPQKRRDDATDSNAKAPAEVSLALSLLGKSGATYQEADLRGADLSGVDVRGLDFARGVTLFGANLTGAVIVDSTIGSCNVGEANLNRAWFGGCFLNGLHLVDAQLIGARFPSTRLSGCQLAGADITGCDFSTSQLNECDFSGVRLVAGSQRNAHWDEDRVPMWPPGFVPNLR